MAIIYNFTGGLKMCGVTVFDVANYFLKVVDREFGSSITHLKLQKLVYYAQAWHLVFAGKPMFEARLEAWVHGPVFPKLYQKYSIYGFDSLPEPEEDLIELSDEVKGTLVAVWDCYSDYDGKFLEELTHQEDPWAEARAGYQPWEQCNKEISLDTMKDYYTRIQNADN